MTEKISGQVIAQDRPAPQDFCMPESSIMAGLGGKGFCTKNDAAVRLRQMQVYQASRELMVFS